MRKITLKQVQSHINELKDEIKNRLNCDETEDFEIVQYDSKTIGIHWCAIYDKKSMRDADIPYKWIVVGIQWRERTVCMYADPAVFQVFNSK